MRRRCYEPETEAEVDVVQSKLNGFSSAIGLMGLKRGQHQQQSMMMMMPLLRSTSNGYDASGGGDCDQFTYRNIRKSRYEVETGEGSSDAVKDADEKADDHGPKEDPLIYQCG
ncbi:hypothetical protein DY000_02041202 [Brassica cretica]|uniref:Uncharacterized protein n=1 Tax=Brassica cretica TaxID=69181 RepID=A0ABQ7B5B3_BRACR|nr:hypothetical protein DY000_02041202 [Brassica cretica]